MSSLIQEATIKVRQDTAGNWTSSNPTPLQGEWCLETDTGNIKIGDGSTAWNSLLYYDDTMIGTKKDFFTYKDRTDWGYLPFAFDNAISTTTYSALYSEVGDVFEAQHVAAGDSASGAGMFYPTPVPGAYDRVGIPDQTFTETDVDIANDRIANLTGYITSIRDGSPIMFIVESGTPPTTSPQITTDTIYYGRFDDGFFNFYPTEADAVAGTNKITISAIGSGTFRLTQEGIVLDDAFQGHGFSFERLGGSGSSTSLSPGATGDGSFVDTTLIQTKNIITDSVNGTPRTTNETRPKTNYVFSYIKARKI